MPKAGRIFEVGERYGRLTVTERQRGAQGVHVWCLCDCGESKLVRSYNLANNTRSCGCLAKDALRARAKHGHSRRGMVTRTRNIWGKMHQRCTNPNVVEYSYYGGRGISVCAAWADYSVFLADMGECPPGLSIDRINNDEGYSPGNRRRATSKEQALNRRPRALRPHCGRNHLYAQDARIDCHGHRVCGECEEIWAARRILRRVGT